MAGLPILLVDDDRGACNTLAILLSVSGYQTDVAHNGIAALNLLKTKEYGLAISDYQMPDMNGIDLFRCIRRLRPDLPGLLLTGHSKSHLEELALEAGILHVLSKPADFHELIPLIERCLARHHSYPDSHAESPCVLADSSLSPDVQVEL